MFIRFLFQKQVLFMKIWAVSEKEMIVDGNGSVGNPNFMEKFGMEIINKVFVKLKGRQGVNS
jgi:hypothetical protein